MPQRFRQIDPADGILNQIDRKEARFPEHMLNLEELVITVKLLFALFRRAKDQEATFSFLGAEGFDF